MFFGGHLGGHLGYIIISIISKSYIANLPNKVLKALSKLSER